MDGARCMTWKEFKESLDNMVGKRIMYIDEEGTEIPINTDAEFQEALRLAKRQGNRVRFVLVNESYDEGRRPTRQNSKSKEKYAYKEARHSKTYQNEEVKEAVYVNDAPPDWFASFMIKFKHDLMTEVGDIVYDTVQRALKKEAKSFDDFKYHNWENFSFDVPCVGTQYYYRSDGGYQTPAYFVTSQPLPASGSVRMRPTEKVYVDQMKEERRAKQYTKAERARLNSLDKRQNKERWMNVPTVGSEERVKASKSRAYPKVYISYVHDFGPIKSTKSASFTSNLSLKKLEVLQPYALWFLLGNNGSVPWSNNAYVKCFYNPDEFDFEDNVIELPSLEPGVGANVVYEVTPLKVGSFSFTCAIIDNGVEIGERILCRFEVVKEEGMKMPKPTKVQASKKEAQQPCEHHDDEFTKTQKKIKENIKTIMKRLDDIEVLNSDSSSKGDSKKKEDDSVKVGQKRNRKKRKEGTTIEFRTGVFDLLQNLESIRENEEGKPKDEEKEIVKDKLVGTEDKQPVKEDKKDKQNGNGKKKEEGYGSDGNQSMKDENKKEAADAERRDSDSELSVIMASEEDDNFIVLSMPSRTPSPETQVKELENDKENNKEREEAKEKEKEKEIEKEKEKGKEKGKEKEKEKGKEKEKEKEKEKKKEKEKEKEKESPREEEKKSTFESNTFDPWNEKKNRENPRFDPWNEKKSQPDPFDDGPKDNNEKKKKWGFHVVNLPECTTKFNGKGICFLNPNVTPEEVLGKLKNGNLNLIKDEFILTQDNLDGNIVFVVDRGGKCVPVVSGNQKKSAETGKRQKNAEAKENKHRESRGESSGSPTGSGQPKESPDPSNLPNLLLYNAASDAVTKVASAFSNIPSAFLPGGTEKKTLSEKRRPIMLRELLGYLEDMGFTDRIRNRKLLWVHNLNMPAVIEELLKTTPGARDNPPTGIFLSKQGIFGQF